ncbi:MAG: Hsp70 family protein [Thermogutta sp.]|nr:Hsp70 family protein [Thermogutta sp.]
MYHSEITEPAAPRFVVGIDLGTTNSALCYVDTAESPWQVRVFRIPQLVAPGQVEERETLPSFHYEPAPGEFDPKLLRLPFGPAHRDHIVGVFARDHGAEVPGRLISSAKSWLCHTGVDRTAPLLPWHGAPDATKLSPVEVSARYLEHLRDAWDSRFPGYPLADQDLVLTIPASFDEVARQLTVKAAAQAGLKRVTLIEEPQAAFYAWIYRHSEDWQRCVRPGQKILVCDIGGGTTDFTLIRVRESKDGMIQFHRVAVGEHLILGGDNLDLALAHHIERKLNPDEPLDPQTWSILVRRCQFLKEKLLSEPAPERITVTLPGRGSRVVGGARHFELTRNEVLELVLDGFFPLVELDARPAVRRSGFQEFGLPFAPDPAVTRYLAAFLTAHRFVALDGDSPGHDPARPDLVLFNGGVFYSHAIRRRVVDVIARWFSSPQRPWQPIVLENERLDLAVAQGAAYYGMVRRGEGVRISAGLARTYYIGVAMSDEELRHLAATADAGKSELAKAELPEPELLDAGQEGESQVPEKLAASVCVLPAGIEPGEEVHLAECTFHLRIGEPVEFPVYYSGTRLTDPAGAVVLVRPEELSSLPAVRTILKVSSRRETPKDIAVTLHAKLTEIGTLEIWCSEVGGNGRWKLEFDVRSAVQTDRSPHQGSGEQEGVLEESLAENALELIDRIFGPEGTESPAALLRKLSEATRMNRRDWPSSFLRRIWQRLMENEAGRRRSPEHEARWLNTLGYALRPGYGLAADDWRVAETWRVLQGKLVHATPACRAEWWILWRRIAGGLTAGQQQALATPLMASVRSLHRQQIQGTGSTDFPYASHEGAEIWRLLGSLELLPLNWKVELGQIILDLLPKRRVQQALSALLWTLARLGARIPVYAPLNSVLPEDVVTTWIERLLRLKLPEEIPPYVLMQLARKTGDRYRDVANKTRQRVLAWFSQRNVPEHLVRLVAEGGTLEETEQTQIFGEELPRGLRIL